MNLNLIAMPGNNLSSYVDRAPHKVLLLLAILQEDPETIMRAYLLLSFLCT